MKRLPLPALLALFFCTLPAMASVQVSISQPRASSAVSSPFTVAAHASSSHPITGWYVYADNQPVFHQSGASLGGAVSLAAGNHTLLVRAWDSTGAYGSQRLSVSVQKQAPPAGVTVSVSSPGSGATVGSPVQVSASASSGHPITGWYVYADNAPVYHQSGANLSGSFSLAAGNHTLTFRAWDSTGANGAQNVPVTVQSSKNTTVFNHIEDMSGWGECGNRSCAGGADASVFWMAPFQRVPSLDGSAAEFFIAGPPYADALHWKKVGVENSVTNYLWDFWVQGDSASLSAQALEFDLYTVVPINGQNRKFMFGTQCDYGAGVWDGWNEPTNHWVHTSVPCSRFAANTWHHIVWSLRRTGASNASLEYLSLTVDGVTHNLNLVEPSTPTSWAETLGVQFQQDEGKNGTPYHEWVDKVTLTIW